MKELERIKIGETEDLEPVYIEGKDRYRHILLAGKSGTGKSTILTNWWQSDHYAKTAKVLIDPSGTLSHECYSISKGKATYASTDDPIAINPMMSGYEPNLVCDIVRDCINQVITLCTPNQPMTAKMKDILDEEIKRALAEDRRSLQRSTAQSEDKKRRPRNHRRNR